MSTESNAITEEPSSSSNATIAPPPEPKKKSESQEQTLARFRSLILTEYGFQANTNDNYLKRLQTLRNELNYIKDTEWMFEPLEKKPPQ